MLLCYVMLHNRSGHISHIYIHMCRFRIYYNQAVPDGVSNLRLVNWYDGDNLGLQKVPLLPNAATVYSNFNGRVFRVPVFQVSKKGNKTLTIFYKIFFRESLLPGFGSAMRMIPQTPPCSTTTSTPPMTTTSSPK